MKEVKLRVSDIDDGGSFDRLVEECRAVGSEGTFLELRVVKAFVDRLRKDSMNEKSALKRKRKLNTSVIYDKEKAKSSKKSKSLGSCDNLPKVKRVKIVFKNKQLTLKLKNTNTNKKTKTKKKMRISNGGGINQIQMSFEQKGLVPPPRISRTLEEKIGEKGGTDIKLVIMKEVSDTDLSKHHGRLSIPENQIKDKLFLTEEEEKKLNEKVEMRVMLMEPSGYESSMVFVKWHLRSSVSYALRTSWNEVLTRNHEEVKHLKHNDVIQLWSFRVGTQLWFAIHKVYDAPSVHQEDQLIAEALGN